jgi:glucose/mannose-6-phosphate isomerase
MTTRTAHPTMQPRLTRLAPLLGEPLFDSILWGHEYSLEHLQPSLESELRHGRFRRIVFYGMGCSSVVSDVMKGFLRAEGLPYQVDVINDYHSEWFIDDSVLQDPGTLIIIVCYSGWSVEPCLFFDRVGALGAHHRLMVLSGGGKIAAMCRESHVSLVQYRLRHADREYPLYHVQQFFAIFLDLFHRLGLTPQTYRNRLEVAARDLRQQFTPAVLAETERWAAQLEGATITCLATPRWNGTLLKQVTMFFNEIAMVPAHRHQLHEWSHTEVAAFSDPHQPMAIIVFIDPDDDAYSREKVATMECIFADTAIVQNRRVQFLKVVLDQGDFCQKYLFGNFLMMHVAFHLGCRLNTAGRDLISITAGNPWWSQASIDRFPRCIDIPANLEPADQS